jgi:MFS family permease
VHYKAHRISDTRIIRRQVIDPKPWPSQRRAWTTLLLFSSVAILSYTDRQVLTLLVDPIRSDLQITDTQVGLLQGAAFGLVYAFSGVILGRFSDVGSRIGMIRAGVLVWSLATVYCGFTHSFSELMLARMVVGIGEATLMPAVISLIPDFFCAARRGTATGIFLTSPSIGAGAALLVGGALQAAAIDGTFARLPLIGHLAPWRLTILLLGLSGMPFAAALWLAREPTRRDIEPATALDKGAPRSSMAILWSARRVILPLLFAMAFAAAGDFSIMSWIPTVLSRSYAWSASRIGEVFGSVIIVASIVGVMAGGILSDLLRRHRGVRSRVTIAFAATIFSVLGAQFALASSGVQVVALAAFWLVTSSAATAAGITTLQEITSPGSRAFAGSLVALCNIAFGFTLGNAGPGFAADHIFRDAHAMGASITLIALPAAVLATLLYWLVLTELKHSASQQPRRVGAADHSALQ